jgi:hypothetical protein
MGTCCSKDNVITKPGGEHVKLVSEGSQSEENPTRLKRARSKSSTEVRKVVPEEKEIESDEFVGTVRRRDEEESVDCGTVKAIASPVKRSSSDLGKQESELLPWQRKDYKMKGGTSKPKPNGKHKHQNSHPTMRELESTFKEHATSSVTPVADEDRSMSFSPKI